MRDHPALSPAIKFFCFFFSRKEESSFSEEKEAKRLLFSRSSTLGGPSASAERFGRRRVLVRH
jgi:hypothetical protein